ncbi:hypothetical protein NM208_g9288 [Fusarium decemcellulare]|uniref:Uncharacterized protein n=1 Tax=Fusarium decemcellulare TaxID=57161 RepID=A0ACC1S2D8_9HYPO|nr:hypothetical protein NM208_g9288 [Fusarium decemcellulare]
MGDIFKLSQQCHQEFQSLSTNLAAAGAEYSEHMPISSIESQHGKFRVWCGNLGAFQSGFASLDYRLREASAMNANVTTLLQQLESALSESNDVISGKRLPFEEQLPPSDSSDLDESTDGSEDEDDSGHRNEIAMRMSSIHSILDDLYRLGHKIRDPNMRPKSNKAALLEARDPESGVDLFQEVAIFDEKHIMETINQLRQGHETPATYVDYLPRRLAAAITRRRKHFRYWERHSMKLAQSHIKSTTTQEVSPPVNTGSQPKLSSGSATHVEETGKENPKQSSTQSAIPTETDATSYDAARDDMTERGTVVSVASTALDVDGKGVELPGPPPEAFEGESFTCPYCFVLCPARQGKGKVWKAHVLQDLQPYVCTYDNCRTPNELYPSRRRWLQHEESIHRRVWRCKDHPHAIFESEEGLRGHFQKEHEDLTEKSLDELLLISAFAHVDDRELCPICLRKPPFQKGLSNHIANHLERISLFSLPRNNAEAENGSAVAVASGKQDTASSTASLDTDSNRSRSDELEGESAESNLLRAITTPGLSYVLQASEGLRELMGRYRGHNGEQGGVPNFIPRFELDKFWNTSTIVSILNAYFPEPQIDPLMISTNFLQVFSLLVDLRQVQHLRRFLEDADNLWDGIFPFCELPSSWYGNDELFRLFDEIQQRQWVFFPCSLSSAALSNQLLGSASILPFHAVEEGFTVGADEVRIFTAQTYKGCTDFDATTLILKIYGEGLQDSYNREREAFNSLTNEHSRDIIRYYGCYRQFQSDATITMNMLFERVEGGNLDAFMQSAKPPRTYEQIRAFWTAFCGVLGALSRFHDSVGPDNVRYRRIHRNIKLTSLHVCKAQKDTDYPFTLKIGGLRFSHIRRLEQQEEGESRADPCHEHPYSAPERGHDSAQALQEITTAADIWSMGCVLSVAAAWVAMGQSGREGYRQARFNAGGNYGSFHDGQSVLDAVKTLHKHVIGSVARSDKVTPQVVAMVEAHMLRPQEERLTAKELGDKLRMIIASAHAKFRTRQDDDD